MDAKLNQLAKITDFDTAYVLAQQAHEEGFRGSTFVDLYRWLQTKIDLTGLSNTAGLPDPLPAPGTTLSATNENEWTILTPGVYNKMTTGTIEVADNEFAFAQFDGVDFNKVQKVNFLDIEKTPLIDNLTTNSAKIGLAASQGVVLANVIGMPTTGIEPRVEEVTGQFPISATRTAIFLERIEGAGDIRLWCVQAGDIMLGSYKVQGNVATRSSYLQVSLHLGLNVISNFHIADGEYFGFNVNTASLLGRVGSLAKQATYSTLVANSLTALPGATSDRRWGVQVQMENPSGLISEKIGDKDLEYIANVNGENIFGTGTIDDNKLVNSAGNIQDANGWKYASVPVVGFKNIGWLNILARQGTGQPVFYRFANESGVTLSFGSFYAGDNKAVTIPAGSARLDINIKSPADPDEVYADAIITTDVIIDKISGKRLSSSNSSSSFNQSLNTADSVKFAGLEVEALQINGMPVGANNAMKGQMFLMADGSGNYNVKVKG